MPVTGVIAIVASLSMAGIPPLNGFLSKEMMLEETTHTTLGNPLLVPALATLGALFSAAYSLPLHRACLPRGPCATTTRTPRTIPALRHVGRAAAAGGGWWWHRGGGPFLLGRWSRTVTGGGDGGAAEMPQAHLKIWHGVTPALWMSVAAVAGRHRAPAGLRAAGAGLGRAAGRPTPRRFRRGSSTHRRCLACPRSRPGCT